MDVALELQSSSLKFLQQGALLACKSLSCSLFRKKRSLKQLVKGISVKSNIRFFTALFKLYSRNNVNVLQDEWRTEPAENPCWGKAALATGICSHSLSTNTGHPCEEVCTGPGSSGEVLLESIPLFLCCNRCQTEALWQILWLLGHHFRSFAQFRHALHL